MNKNFKYKVLLIIGIIVFSLWKVYPPQEKVNLGLDLQGGMHLALEVELDKIPEDARDGAIDRAVEVIRNRIDEFGVSEPTIQPQGIDRIIVQLPGVTDRKRALEIIGRTAHLEFRRVVNKDELYKKAKSGEQLPGYELLKLKHRDRTEEELLLEKEAVLTGDKLMNASVTYGQYGTPIVSLSFDKEGAKIFSDVTAEAVRQYNGDGIDRRLAIVLDGTIHSAPRIKSHIMDGKAIIEGSFAYDEASDLALILRAGALPAPVSVAEERTVGPTLGRDSVRKGIQSMLWGFAIVVAFIALYYLLSGMIAVAALLLNIVIIAGALASFGAALTLPGIAGIILTIGMAVDANVLVFERIREEFTAGKTVRASISSGYHRAFGTILDANITTLITALLLFYFGTGPIKGFAVTLSIGIISSMFTSLFVTRVIFDFLTRDRDKEISLRMFSIIPADLNLDFVSKRKVAFAFSILFICIGLGSFFARGEDNYSIDFTGGMLQQVRFTDDYDLDKLRSSLAEKGLADAQIQTFGKNDSKEVIFRTAGDSEGQVEDALTDLVGKENFEILRVENVGPAVGKELRAKALKAIICALIAIMLYVGWRFKSANYGFAAIVALFHDVCIAVGMLALTGREISLPIIAALLTIVGYSLNDTIVIFDRIREDAKLMRKKKFPEVVNTSINQTVSRTVMTSLTTLIVVIFLFIFGGQVINDFAFTLLIGVIVGTYSSVYVASPMVIGFGNKKK